MSTPAPFLSIVITGRNDNWGGDFNQRFFTALRFNHARLAERGVAFEVVLVEWNPVADRPRLAELVAREFPDLASGALRRIVVAPEYHAALTQNPRISLSRVRGEERRHPARGRPVRAGVEYRHPARTPRRRRDCRAPARVPASSTGRRRYDIKLGADQSRIGWDALEDIANHIRRPTLSPPLYAGGSGDFALADRETFHALRGYNEVYRAAKHGLDHNFLVKAHGAGFPIEDIGGPVYHINHVGSYRISKALYRDNPKEAPWGDNRWHSRHVVYSNPDGWGLSGAPERTLPDGTTLLPFDWRAVPPLVELRQDRAADSTGTQRRRNGRGVIDQVCSAGDGVCGAEAPTADFSR